jgi:prephenate dehydrogenase
MTSPSNSAGRAEIVGTGLIGGSIGLALRQRGWWVTGRDRDEDRAARALAIGALDVAGHDPTADVTFIATPAGAVADEAARALAAGPGVVTDVAGVKAPIVNAVTDPRFVGGHPMTGSEQEGVDGADAQLFEGATWVLTPTSDTDPEAYARLRAIISSLGADVVAMPAERHDELVAMVSHVPHLTAAALMTLATETASEHSTVLRLAAGGFRDMTRIAAGQPGIWPDICMENRADIVSTLERLQAALEQLRHLVASGDRAGILSVLERAREARINLPLRAPRPEDVSEVRVPVPDRPGVLSEVTTLLGELDVNIFDLEIAHSAEGERGVLVMVIDARNSDLVRGALLARGYRPAVRRLG